MAENKRIVWLVLIMMAAVTVSTAVAIAVLYRTSFEEQRSHLIKLVDDQFHTMEAAVRLERARHGGDLDASVAEALEQAKAAFAAVPEYGEIAEITLGQRRGGEIVFLATHGRVADAKPTPVALDSDWG